jgi:hypothetical protein
LNRLDTLAAIKSELAALMTISGWGTALACSDVEAFMRRPLLIAMFLLIALSAAPA